MPFHYWFSWIPGALLIALPLIILLIVGWMAKEYFSLPGHFDVTQNLLGEIGTVKSEISPHQRGKVYVAGAYWDAVSEFGRIPVGKDIQVVEVKERFLVVRPVDLVGRPSEGGETS